MTDQAMDAFRRVSKIFRRFYGRDGRARIVLLTMLREFRPLSGVAAQRATATRRSALDQVTAEVLAENERLTAIVEGRIDRCQARAAFPLDRYDDRQVRRLCCNAYDAKTRGETHPFDCWKEGKKGIWWCEKTTVDRYQSSIGVAPVDFHKVMLAQSKSRN